MTAYSYWISTWVMFVWIGESPVRRRQHICTTLTQQFSDARSDHFLNGVWIGVLSSHERTQPCLRESIFLLMCTFAPAQQLLPLSVLNWSRLTIFYSYRKALDCKQLHLFFGQSMLFVIVIVQCWCLVIGSGAIVIYYRDISSRSLTSCTGQGVAPS